MFADLFQTELTEERRRLSYSPNKAPFLSTGASLVCICPYGISIAKTNWCSIFIGNTACKVCRRQVYTAPRTRFNIVRKNDPKRIVGGGRFEKHRHRGWAGGGARVDGRRSTEVCRILDPSAYG